MNWQKIIEEIMGKATGKKIVSMRYEIAALYIKLEDDSIIEISIDSYYDEYNLAISITNPESEDLQS